MGKLVVLWRRVEEEKPIRAAARGTAAHTSRSWHEEEVRQWAGCSQRLGLNRALEVTDLQPPGMLWCCPSITLVTGGAAQSQLL